MGRRILYLGLDPTRYPLEKSDELVHFPVINTRPLPGVLLNRFETYTHVILTSRTTVALLSSYLQPAQWQDKVVITTGRATTEAFQESIGMGTVITATQESAEGVIAALEPLLPVKKVLYPHSSLARPLIAHYLAEKGCNYTSMPLYETVAYLPGKKPLLSDFDEIVFTSPSTVDAFYQLFAADEVPTSVRLVPIGSVTAEHLKGH